MNCGHDITCSHIGVTFDETKVIQKPDGTWTATCPIGSIFGSEVDGECSGTGATKEEALKKLAEAQHNLSESLWA